MYRTELRALSASITAAMAKTTDHETKAHLEAQGRDRQDPGSEVPAAGAGRGTGGGGRGGGVR